MAYKLGTRVKVIAQSKYPDEKLIGLAGTVRLNYSTSIGVRLDNATNSGSAFGYFYFKPSELLALDEFVEENMEEKNMKAAITNYLNIAKVKLVAGFNDHVYQCANFICDLGVGDLCVVNTDDNAFVVAEVVEVVDRQDIEMRREVIDKIDTKDYNFRVECRAKAAELKAKMKTRAKQLQDVALYQMLAKDDHDMAVLLNEYRALVPM
jgi:hypothetical protein